MQQFKSNKNQYKYKNAFINTNRNINFIEVMKELLIDYFTVVGDANPNDIRILNNLINSVKWDIDEKRATFPVIFSLIHQYNILDHIDYNDMYSYVIAMIISIMNDKWLPDERNVALYNRWKSLSSNLQLINNTNWNFIESIMKIIKINVLIASTNIKAYENAELIINVQTKKLHKLSSFLIRTAGNISTQNKITIFRQVIIDRTGPLSITLEENANDFAIILRYILGFDSNGNNFDNELLSSFLPILYNDITLRVWIDNGIPYYLPLPNGDVPISKTQSGRFMSFQELASILKAYQNRKAVELNQMFNRNRVTVGNQIQQYTTNFLGKNKYKKNKYK